MIRMMMMGCLFSVLSTVLAGVGCWVVTSESANAATRAAETGRAHRERLDRTLPFREPARREETAATMARFLDVRSSLGQAVARDVKAEDWSVGDVLEPRAALGRVMDSRAKHRVEACMKALEAHRMSPREYAWHVRTVYGAVFTGAAAGNAQAADLRKAIMDLVPASLASLGEHAGALKLDELAASAAGTSAMTVNLADKNRARILQGDLVVLDLVALAFFDDNGGAEKGKTR
jgi:hypothetical protein